MYQLRPLCGSMPGAAWIPSRLAKFSNNGLAEAFESWHGLECVECGSCSFVCPARRQLAQSIKTMKKQVLAAKRKNNSKNKKREVDSRE